MLTLREVALAALFLWLCIDSVLVFRHATGKAENRDRFSLGVIVIGSWIALFGSIGLAFSNIGSLHSMALQSVGLVVMGTGIAMRFTAIAQLGHFHSPNVAVRADHRIIDTGLYRYVRHPSYSGALLAYLGFSLALSNWLSIVVIMVVTPCIYLFRIREEEKALADAFGDDYQAYCRRTKRLVPGLY